MATMITSECINCGACEPECPNTAIYQGGVRVAPDGSTHAALCDSYFYIVPEKCTECVGFHDKEACAAVCPVDCCVPNPDLPETHEVLLGRARALHPEAVIADDAPSRFRVGAAAPAAAKAPEAVSAKPEPVAPAAAPATPPPAPATPPPAAAAPAPAVKPAAPQAATPAAAKPTPVAAPAAAAAAAPPAAARSPPRSRRSRPGTSRSTASAASGDYRRAVLQLPRGHRIPLLPTAYGPLVPTLSMATVVRQVADNSLAVAGGRPRRCARSAGASWPDFEERRRRAAPPRSETHLRTIAEREHPAGAPRPRRSAFAF